jgi:CheY-like chemotaxis protein
MALTDPVAIMEKRQRVEQDFTDLDFTKRPEAAAQGTPSSKQAATGHEGAAGASEPANKGSGTSIARCAKNLTPSPPGAKYRLLLIDDDTEFSGIMQKMLSMAGYSVRTASNRAAIAAELQGSTGPHLIILDVNLGELSGFDILAHLRQHRTLSAVPVIMLTAQTARTDVTRGLLGGADGYVSKPCEFVTLNHAIRTVLDIR